MNDAASITETPLHETLRVGGEKIDRDERIEVFNPWDNSVVGTVPCATRADVARAFDIAASYTPTLTRYERQQILLRTAEILTSRRDEISDLITAELGISKQDSLYEVGRAFDVFSLAGQLCIIDDGEIFSCDLTPHGKQRRIYTQRDPLKAISAITPFNHPMNMVAHKIAPAIATNNCMVCKPTELTPLTALLLADVLYEAGLPPEMFSVVTGLPGEIGEEMITNANIELITFTGGVPVGKHIANHAGYRRTVLELGGNSSLIVMEDADLEKAAVMAAQGATKNSGQRCTAVKRVLCIERVADEFAPLVVREAQKIRYGDPMFPDTDMGTVVHEAAAQLFEKRVDDAVSQGATLLYGNERRGALYSPTVLDHVPRDAELVVEETFGPPVPIIRVRDIDDAIAVDNGTVFGLSTGVCTNRWDYITRFVSELKTGTVNIWEVPGYRIEMSPFGGVKDSGLGYKEGVIEAMKSYTTVKTYSLPW
ncbi:MAG: phosphonoacetaldehyde dehydrogenase [Arenicellales bacterium]|jgi:putative phosphonoacetaldehyde dehydrogenase|nr:phosphonoacetaldehyde dehydrogenase [Arenicellales bacterium]MDP6552845.1 phosphonoacetaldehyde dehydrogenase [Arenicellales bacterium]MDP6791082.1 phosphonoacetaldehyde dehydrogenase [Arenicellales bacterium]MDP6919090.1 phosphonoacetaldehyde dehydrogenase [Arenicellales bacterium]|tara:strand:+ start:23743 stop:25188 length:1446 start_codon:yes stop_codon:yes gene_type:complete